MKVPALQGSIAGAKTILQAAVVTESVIASFVVDKTVRERLQGEVARRRTSCLCHDAGYYYGAAKVQLC
ncbi:hypothetical protein TNCV_4642601 [Trichonephila clavipes]|nr:hypothetical protein TNCV_4642601 [Trichonephila clavipes]